MALLADESIRLLREKWPDASELALEIFAILQSSNPLQITGPVTITNPTNQPGLSINQLGDAPGLAVFLPPDAASDLNLPQLLDQIAILNQQQQQGLARKAVVLSVETDSLTCTAAGAQVTVLKPVQLRQSTPPRPGVDALEYTSDDAQARTATIGKDSEDQVVVPNYLIGDVLYVAGVDDATVIDLNVDARAWATRADDT